MYIYIYIYMYIYIHIYITYMHISRHCYAQLYLHTWAPTRLRTHTRARASAVPPRTTARAASTTRRARPAAGPKGGAYIGQVGDTRGVPRADVRAERRRVGERLRAEPTAVHADGTRSPWSTPTERARMCRRGCERAQSHTHTHARTDAARGRVCAAGAHRRSLHRCSQPRMDIDTCMRCVYVHCVCACSIDGWPYEDSAPHSRTSRALAHRPRPHAIARVHKNTHAYPFTCPDFASKDIY
jgi:hypothetical protein